MDNMLARVLSENNPASGFSIPLRIFLAKPKAIFVGSIKDDHVIIKKGALCFERLVCR